MSVIVLRTLRILTLLAFLALGLLAVADVFVSLTTPDETGAGPLPTLLFNLAGQASYTLGLVAGVIGVVVSAQQRQRGWLVVFAVALAVAFVGPEIALTVPSLQAFRDWQFFFILSVITLVSEVLVPVVGVVYLVTHRGGRVSTDTVRPAPSLGSE